MNNESWIISHEYQVNKPNGDIDFITVYDLPERLSRKFVEDKYPGCSIEIFETKLNPAS